LLSRPLVVAEYPTITKSGVNRKPVSRNLKFVVWVPTIIFLKMAPMQFYLGI
jgi:hypothetical protein